MKKKNSLIGHNKPPRKHNYPKHRKPIRQYDPFDPYNECELPDDEILLNLPSREKSLFDVHHPKDSKSLVRAQKRLKFEEFFFLQLHLLKLKLTRI